MRVKGLKKIYRIKGGESVVALYGVSFDLPAKGMVFILGRSGSGKSTLLNLMSGLDKADEGSIEVDGKDITKLTESELSKYRNSCCGFVFQEYNLIPELSVGENIELSLELQGNKETAEKVKEALGQVGLEGYEKRKVTELSGGQKQRIAIARAIIKDPKIIYADEPTGALDEKTGQSIFELMKRISSDRLVVAVTHDREFAERYGDRIIELADGKIVSDTDAREISAEEKESEWKKPKLPLKAALKIGCSNFRYHPIRLIATIILSVLTFTLLGVSLNFGLSQFEDVAYNSMVGYGLEQSAIVKNIEGNIPVPIKENEKQEIEKKLGKTSGVVWAYPDIPTEQQSENIYYKQNSYGFAEISEGIASRLGFSFTGRLPQGENEIAITEFYADVINELNYFEENKQDLIGKNLEINEKEYLITALIDTNFDFAKYAELKQGRSDEQDVLIELFEKELSSSLHNFIFMNDISSFAGEEITTSNSELYLSDRYSVDLSKFNKNDSSYEIYKSNDEGSNYLSSDFIPLILQFNECDVEYNGKQFLNYGELFDELYGGEDYMETYIKYKDIYSFPTSFKCRIKNTLYNIDYEITIGGFFKAMEEYSIILSDDVYKEIYEKIGGKYDRIFAAIKNNAVKQYISKSGEFKLDNYVIDKVQDYWTSIETFKSVSYILSGIFAFFAIALLLNFMLQSVIDKTKIIGILKANGCNNVILSKIFIVEGMIIALIVFVFVSLFVLLCCSLINKLLINIFGVKTLVFPILLAVISVFSALGSLLPIFRMRKYSPNDIIAKN